MPNVGDHVRVHSRKVGEASRDGPGSLAVIEKKELSSDNKGSAPSKATEAMKSGQKAQKNFKKPPR